MNLRHCLISILILFFVFLTSPAQAAQNPTPSLTLDILQERLHNPTVRDGSLTVDLRDMVIDLRPENASFRDGFYQLLRGELQKTGTKPLGLDLSKSIIKGEFIGSNLGLRTPLYIQAIAPIFTPTEQSQLEQLRSICWRYSLEDTGRSLDLLASKDCKSLLNERSGIATDISVFRGTLTMVQTQFYGQVQFANTFFLQPVEVTGAKFYQPANWAEVRFSRAVSFRNAIFKAKTTFTRSIFFERANFAQVHFSENTDFLGSYFNGVANFHHSIFQQLAEFNRTLWHNNSNFSQVQFANQAQFTKANFQQFLFLTESNFEQAVTFREALFNQPVNLRGANILNQADFSDAEFNQTAYLNVSSLNFNSNQAKILGNPGQIGGKLMVARLQGNQNVLRNLGQNFRQLQQIGDANQIEYTKQRLRLLELSRHLTAININIASSDALIKLGFTPTQAEAIANARIIKPFRQPSELLTLPEIDESTYNQVVPHIIADKPLSFASELLQGWSWLGLSLLLLLSGYGTNVCLVLAVGTIAIAYFGLLFWFCDRWRRLHPLPIIPHLGETNWMLASFSVLSLFGILAIFRSSQQPWLTLACLCIIIIPLPIALLLRMYQQGRYHDLMEVSYFTEDGTMRQLRLLIGRLPIIPRYELFRERYMYLLWNRNWNWLNYYDFSLNNFLKLGFNDVRLRDEHLPGIISTLAWYQWSLGIIYIILLLWTLSRTIPGVNLLIYLK